MTLPYFPYWVDDYEADTAHLTIEEDGAYVRLLRLCWRTPGCSLPDDEDWLRRRMRVNEDEFERAVRPVIEEYFTSENGRLFQKRLCQIWEEAHEAHRKRVEAGGKGGNAKALKSKETDPSNALASITITRARTTTRARTETNNSCRIEEGKNLNGLGSDDGPFGGGTS